ncbi:MAG: SoxR reducing system RseC family protein [Bacteroidales bacterium]|jgi:sigma-E factor negative regulatory protein RseC|nr:SoxR reducing system RseC family protein [Bacteroidales bacterium]
MKGSIEHEGIVTAVSGQVLTVRITSAAACSGCAARNRCMPSEGMEKELHIEGVGTYFVEGEKVKVSIHPGTGLKALGLAYLLPLVPVLLSLPVAYRLTGNELASGGISLLALAFYYLLLRIFRHKIGRSFRFEVKKIDESSLFHDFTIL